MRRAHAPHAFLSMAARCVCQAVTGAKSKRGAARAGLVPCRLSASRIGRNLARMVLCCMAGVYVIVRELWFCAGYEAPAIPFNEYGDAAVGACSSTIDYKGAVRGAPSLALACMYGGVCQCERSVVLAGLPFLRSLWGCVAA